MTPIAFVSIVDERRQVFLSQYGLPAELTEQSKISASFCRYVVAGGEPMVVEDSRREPALQDNPAVSEIGIIAYLGMPLMMPDGTVMGTFCVIDRQTRKWQEKEVYLLQVLARSVVTEIELIIERANRGKIEAELHEINANIESTLDKQILEIKRTNELLAKIDRFKSSYIERLAMEMLLPVTNLSLYLKLLRDGRPEKQNQYMCILKKQSERLSELIRMLLEFSDHRPEDWLSSNEDSSQSIMKDRLSSSI
jgi:GAF domain-containing protein